MANERRSSVQAICRSKVVDIFSGVGGLSLGAARAGLSVAAAVENDAHALHAHKKNFPNTSHIASDAASVSSEQLCDASASRKGELFGVIGGPPCQGFSSMGHRRLDDPRNQLFLHFFRFVRDLQPAFFLAENVPGILDSTNDELRAQAVKLVQDDYEVLPPVKVSAEHFGLATSRTRYLFLGYKSTHFRSITKEDIQVKGAPLRVRDMLNGLPTRIHASWNTELQSWRRIDYSDTRPEVVKWIRDNIPAGVGDQIAISRLKENRLASGFLGTRHTHDVLARFAKLKQGQADRISKSRRLDLDGLCPTLRAGTAADRGSYQAVRPIHPTADRVITPREAARLQSFPDWFQFSPTKWHSFRQIGNSVCPGLATSVFRAMIAKRIK